MKSELIQFNFLDRRSIYRYRPVDLPPLFLCSFGSQLPRQQQRWIYFSYTVEGCRSIVRLFDRLNFHMKDQIDLLYFFVITGTCMRQRCSLPKVAANRRTHPEPHLK